MWNKVATERVKRFGISPVIGDLYLARDALDTDNVQVVSDPTDIDIFQVVLPLPGYNIAYPKNEIGVLYKEILSNDGIALSKDSIPESTAKGSYRKLIQRTNKLTWESIDDDKEDVCGRRESDPTISNAKLTFELESGSYATMMLRELMVNTIARDFKGLK